jgi:hypothetical protein
MSWSAPEPEPLFDVEESLRDRQHEADFIAEGKVTASLVVGEVRRLLGEGAGDDLDEQLTHSKIARTPVHERTS